MKQHSLLDIENSSNQSIQHTPVHVSSSNKNQLEVQSNKSLKIPSVNSSVVSSVNLNFGNTNDSINLYKDDLAHENSISSQENLTKAIKNPIGVVNNYEESETKIQLSKNTTKKVNIVNNFKQESKTKSLIRNHAETNNNDENLNLNFEKKITKNLVNSLKNFSIVSHKEKISSPIDAQNKLQHDFIDTLKNYNLGACDELKCSVCCVNNLKFNENFFAKCQKESSIILNQSQSNLNFNELACKINSFNPFSTDKCKHIELYESNLRLNGNDFENLKSVKSIESTATTSKNFNYTKINQNQSSMSVKFQYNVLESSKSNANDLFKKMNSNQTRQIKNLESISAISNNLDMTLNSSSTISLMNDSQNTDLISGKVLFNSSEWNQF